MRCFVVTLLPFSVFQSADSARAPESSNMSRVAEQLLAAFKGLEPHKVALVLSELQSDPQMAGRAGLDAEIKEILQLLGGPAEAPENSANDIMDEEEFLYGDSGEPKSPAPTEPVRHYGLDLYADVTEETLYGDYLPQRAAVPQRYGAPAGASAQPPARPTAAGSEGKYVSRPAPATVPQQNATAHVSNSTYLPGMEPLEEGERQALEEYEKIQDLLKTIGLDLGVAEISKMAARTKERLHGNKPPPKTPTRRRRYSSGSSGGSGHSRGRTRWSHSSSPSSSSHSRSRGHSWSSDDGARKGSAPPMSLKNRDGKEMKVERSAAAPPPQNKPESHPPHPGMPIPTFPPPQVPAMMPPNFPPPPYGQYGNYLPYMHQQWPSMFPPPNMSLPPQTDFPPALPYSQAGPELGVKGQ